GFLGLGHDRAHALGGALGEADDLGARTARTGLDCGFHQNMFNCSLASSDISDGSQGGSNTRLTAQDLNSGTLSTASRTHSGISPATGQPGAVKVMSMTTSFWSETSTL